MGAVTENAKRDLLVNTAQKKVEIRPVFYPLDINFAITCLNYNLIGFLNVYLIIYLRNSLVPTDYQIDAELIII